MAPLGNSVTHFTASTASGDGIANPSSWITASTAARSTSIVATKKKSLLNETYLYVCIHYRP